jgi:hypothetical protein
MEFQENGTLMGGRQKFIIKETSSKVILGVCMYRIYASAEQVKPLYCD